MKENFDPSALPTPHGFSGASEYSDVRNLIGALTLLPRSRNRSLQDKPYREKLTAYATENVLVQTLCENFYQNHPNVAVYSAANPQLKLGKIVDFSRDNIIERGNFYKSLAEKIWSAP